MYTEAFDFVLGTNFLTEHSQVLYKRPMSSMWTMDAGGNLSPWSILDMFPVT